MKICTYYTDAQERVDDLERRVPRSAKFGVVRGEAIHLIEWPASLASQRQIDLPDLLDACAGDLSQLAVHPAPAAKVADVYLGPPVLRPPAFLDFYTFEQHVRTCRAKRGLDVVPEWYEVPVYYNSNAASLYGHQQRVHYPASETKLDFELELAAVLGRSVRDANPIEAEDAICGYTILNDLSARALQAQAVKVGLGPARGKDHGSTLGPVLVTRDELPNPRDLQMRAFVNGQQWSEGNSASGHYSFGEMIQYASMSRTLHAGSVIGSGTVGTGCGLELDRFLSPGDRVRLEIDGIGALETLIAQRS